MTDTDKADPASRRTAVVILCGGAVVGATLIGLARLFRPDIEAWVTADPESRIRVLFGVLTICTSGPVLGLSIYLWRLAQKTIRAGQYPPPGSRFTRDPPVATGESAQKLGRTFKVLAVGLGSTAVLLATLLWWLLFTLGPRIAERRV